MKNWIYEKRNYWWGWTLSWFGLRERGEVHLRCTGCDYEQKIVVWCRPGEGAWEALQREVKAVFERNKK